MGKKMKEPEMQDNTNRNILEKFYRLTPNKTDIQLSGNNVEAMRKHIGAIENTLDDINELFPDLELAIETMSSLILSPNDLLDTRLNYNIKDFKLPLDVRNTVLDVIKTHISDKYKIEDKLHDIITETLYTKGSYIELNLPSNNLLDVLKFIKQTDKTIGAESVDYSNYLKLGIGKDQCDEMFTITDNYLNLLDREVNETALSVGIESKLFNTLNVNVDVALESLFIDGDRAVLDGSKISGSVIVKKLRSFNVVPVCTINDPSKHYGYFVFLDETGNGLNASQLTADDALAEVKKNIYIKSNVPTIGDISDIRTTLLKNKLEGYLKDSVYKDLVSTNIEIDDDLLMAVVDNILHASKIKVVFLPEDFVSYYAINFRKNGTGKSLLEKVIVLASMRGILLFTNLLSYIKSSMTTTNVDIELDPDDPNYKKTTEMIMSEVMKNRQISLPIGMLKADDFVDWAHKLGFSFNVKHPALPDVNVSVSEESYDINPVDTSLKDEIDKLIITSLYLTPEMFDDGFTPEFATTVIQSNKLLVKRIIRLQDKFNILITKDVKKKLKVDKDIKNKLKNIIYTKLRSIKSNLKKNNNNITKDTLKGLSDEVVVEWIVNKIISKITLSLPRPEVIDDDYKSNMLSNFTDMIDDVLDKTISTDILPSDMVGEFGDVMDNVRESIKAIMIKRYIVDNDILPEYNEMFTLDENGRPNDMLLQELQEYLKTLTDLSLPFIKTNRKFVDKLDETIEKLDEEEDEDENLEDNEDDTTEEPETIDTEEETNEDLEDKSDIIENNESEVTEKPNVEEGVVAEDNKDNEFNF